MHDRYASSQVQVSREELIDIDEGSLLEDEYTISSESDHEYDSADCSGCSEFEKLSSQELKEFDRYGGQISEVTDFVIPSIMSIEDSSKLSGSFESEQNQQELRDEIAE